MNQMNQVICLNADYSFLGVVPIKKAFKYIACGKVQVERYFDSFMTTCSEKFGIPMVVRFIKLIRQVFAKKVPWSKKNVLIRDNYICQYCGSTESKMTVDHIVPKSRGGKNSFENAVCACKACNNKKGDRIPSEANMFLKMKPVRPTISEFSRKMGTKYNLEEILGFIA